MRVLLFATQLNVDGPGPYMVKCYQESLFLSWQEVSQAKQSEISSELIYSSQGTLYCLCYLLKKEALCDKVFFLTIVNDE